MHKPEIGSSEPAEVLPEDSYEGVIVGYEMQEKRAEFIAADEKEWAKKHGDKPMPTHKKFQYVFEAKVAEGEHEGRWLPRKYTTTFLNTDERNGLLKYLSKIPGIEGSHKTLIERIDAGDAPDFDSEVLGKPIIYDVVHNAKGYASIDNVRKSKRKVDVEAELKRLGATIVEDADLDAEIPF